MSWRWEGYAGGSARRYEYEYDCDMESSTYKKTQPRQNREQHMEKLEIWRCKICDKEYASKSGLNRHFSTIHEPQPKAIKDTPRAMAPYRANTSVPTCTICNKEFASQGNLTRHLNTVHQPQGTTVTKNKLVQKSQTNVVINMYKPTIYNYRD